MNFNNKGFTLIESLFAFSIYTTVLVMLISLYSLNGKNITRLNKEYNEYINEQVNIENSINYDEGIEVCLRKVLR